MAAKNANKGLPANFTPPFTRVEMKERMDDSLACVATLTNRTLEDITKMAVDFGLPAHGPCFVNEDMIAKLLMRAGALVATKYREFVSFDAMPYVAILLVDYDENTEIGRHVVWHHVKGTKDIPSFSYIIDPAYWVAPAGQLISAVELTQPAYFIEVTPKPSSK